MGHQVVHGRAAHEVEVQVQAHHAAGVADGAEHIIGEVTAVGTQGTGVGVGGHHRAAGQAQQVPKAGVGQVGHVGVYVQFLHAAEEITALIAETAFRVLGARAGEGVGVVPHRVQQTHAPAGYRV